MRERDVHQMQARIRRDLREKVDGFRNDAGDGIDLARLQLLQRRRLVDQDLIDLDAEPLEHDGAGEARAGAGRAEINLLAAQILEALNVVARQDVEFRDRQPDDVVDALLEIWRFADRAEILEDVGLGDGRVDPC